MLSQITIGFIFIASTFAWTYLPTRLSRTVRGTNKWGPLQVATDSISSAPAVSPNKPSLLNDPNSMRSFLNIFVVDCSSPGGNNRISAVQGAVVGILTNREERGHACVISCYSNDAEIVLEPTSSITKAYRCLSNMKKSVMGNLARGIEVALELVDKTVQEKSADEIMVTIVSHAKAHGLLAHSSDCESDFQDDLCNIDLNESATTLSNLSEKLRESGIILRSIVIDADPSKDDDDNSGEEGERLAGVCRAEYFHSPELTDEDILRYITIARSA